MGKLFSLFHIRKTPLILLSFILNFIFESWDKENAILSRHFYNQLASFVYFITFTEPFLRPLVHFRFVSICKVRFIWAIMLASPRGWVWRNSLYELDRLSREVGWERPEIWYRRGISSSIFRFGGGIQSEVCEWDEQMWVIIMLFI